MNAKKVSIIIVNYNNPLDTVECLARAKRSRYPNYSVIVVDNGSTDDSVRIFHSSFPDVQLIETGSNFGYPVACNIGMRYALSHGADYLLLLNNDVLVDENAIVELVEIMQSDRSIGITGPKVYFYHNKSMIFSAGGRLGKITAQSQAIGQGELDSYKHDVIREVDYVSGCAFLVKRELLSAIGYMDPRYFMFYDEVDLCIRTRKNGYKVVFVPMARVWHKVSATARKVTGLKEYYITRNRFILQKKFLRKWEYVAFLTWFFLIWFPFHVVELLLSRASLRLTASFLRGLIDGLRTRVQACI